MAFQNYPCSWGLYFIPYITQPTRGPEWTRRSFVFQTPPLTSPIISLKDKKVTTLAMNTWIFQLCKICACSPKKTYQKAETLHIWKIQVFSVHPPPTLSVTNEGLGWDSRSLK